MFGAAYARRYKEHHFFLCLIIRSLHRILHLISARASKMKFEKLNQTIP